MDHVVLSCVKQQPNNIIIEGIKERVPRQIWSQWIYGLDLAAWGRFHSLTRFPPIQHHHCRGPINGRNNGPSPSAAVAHTMWPRRTSKTKPRRPKRHWRKAANRATATSSRSNSHFTSSPHAYHRESPPAADQCWALGSSLGTLGNTKGLHIRFEWVVMGITFLGSWSAT